MYQYLSNQGDLNEVKGKLGESRGVKESQGESWGVMESQSESWGVKGSPWVLGDLREFHGEPLETNRAKCLSVSESVNLSVLELPAQLKTRPL